MLFSINTNYKSYKEISVTDLVCPLSGKKEPMKLVLYQAEIKSFGIITQAKKPTGVFFSFAEKKDIPISLWTEEMEAFFHQKKTENPVPKKGIRLTLFGKIFATFSVLVLAIITWKIFSFIVIDPIKKQNAKSELLKLPEKGDQYNVYIPIKRYDSNGQVTAVGIQPTWVEVVSVSPDSTCVLLPIEQLPYGTKMEVKVAEKQRDDQTFVTKFKPITEQKISFILEGETLGFEAETFGNIENTKRKSK